MSVPLEYLLHVYCENSKRTELRLSDLIEFLRTLWRDYRIAIFDSSKELLEHLQILKDLDVIDIEERENEIIIKIRDQRFLRRRAQAIEASYLAKIDAIYRDILNKIKHAAKTLPIAITTR